MDRNCRLCKLGCGSAVPGTGNKNPKLIVLTDFPYAADVEEGRPHSGPFGRLLKNVLNRVVGLDPEQDIYYALTIRCRPGDAIDKKSVQACRRWTQEDLREVNCDLVLIAGSLTFQTLLPQVVEQAKLTDPKFNLAKAHGQVYRHLGKTYFVTFSPSDVEAGTFKREVAEDEYKPWYPTGSVPWLFLKDMKKLKTLIEDTYREGT